MALIKNKVAFAFSEGIETKNDDKQQAIGSLLLLENSIFETPNKVRKRNGYNSISITDLENNTLSNIRTITSYLDELCLYTDKNFYSFSESNQRWVQKGLVEDIFPNSVPVIRNSYEQSAVDGVYVDGIGIFTWEDSRGGIRTSVLDTETNNFLISDEEISATGSNPRIGVIFNNIFIIYLDGNDINYRKLNSFSPTTIEPETNIASDANSGLNKLDVVSEGNKVFIGYASTSGSGDFQMFSLNEIGTTSSTILEAGEVPSDALDISTDEASRIVVTYSNGTEIKIIVYAFTLGVKIITPTVIEAIADVVNITTIKPSADFDYTIFYEISATETYNHYVKSNTVDLAATVGTPSVLKRSVGLASKAFTYNSDLYVTTVHDSDLQDSYFVIDKDANIICKVSPSLGGGILTTGSLPKVEEITSTSFQLTSQIKGKNVVEGTDFFSLLGVNRTELEFNKSNRNQNEVLAESLHTAGGIIKMYDGADVVEHGFHVFPENVTVSSTPTTGGFLSDGTYQVSVLYRWVDNKGQEHLSAPSIPISVTLSGGTGTQTIELSIPTLRLTNKENVTIDTYRSESNGTVLYKESELDTPTVNDPTVDAATFTLSISDSDLIANELIYIEGGVLDNIAAPSASIIESFNNRLWIAGLENESSIQFSKIRTEGRPVEFSDILTKLVPRTGGAITALKAMDDKLIIFKETATYYLSGDGPNNLGEQDTFINVELLSSEIGCQNPDSVVLTPLGVMFKSKKGIYLLTRGMSFEYEGAPVEGYNDLTISSSEVISNKNQVRFLTIDGECITYDYYVRKWSVFTNHKGTSATNLLDVYYYVRTDDLIYKENDDSFTDSGSPIKLRIETDWLSFGGIQGFQRVYRAMFLGSYKSPHKIRIRVAYNYIDSFIQEKIIDVSDFTDDTRYGEYSPYGDPTDQPYGGDGNLYQFRVDFKKQKSQSIKIRIEDIQTETLGEGFDISNMFMIIGIKVNEFKINQSRVYGTS